MKILDKIFGTSSKKPTLVIDSHGINTIGGKPSPEFEIPEFKFGPLVYLGSISKDEKELEILNFDFQMICPIFMDLSEPIYFDYENSKKPIIIESVETNFYQYFEEISPNTYVEYKKLNFSLKKLIPIKTKIGVHQIDMIPDEIGIYEKPLWIHDEKWPICPINGKKMKFLFQFGDIDESVNIKGQETLDKEYIEPYLNFRGNLYVFYEPESKIIAYLIQYE
jgi:hypothetical protein